MVKQRSLGPDNMDDGSDASSAFLDALRTRAMDDLHHAALEYGIIMKDLGAFGQGCVLIFRQGLMWGTMYDSRHRQAVQGRHRADHGQAHHPCAPGTGRGCRTSSHITSPQRALQLTCYAERGQGEQQQDQAGGGCALRRPRQGPSPERQPFRALLHPYPYSSLTCLSPTPDTQTKADAEAYSIVKAAEAQAKRTQIEAEAQAKATRLAAEAEAEAIRVRAAADAAVVDQFAREMELRRTEVRRVSAFGDKTIFVPTDGLGSQLGGAMATGFAAGLGSEGRKA